METSTVSFLFVQIRGQFCGQFSKKVGRKVGNGQFWSRYLIELLRTYKLLVSFGQKKWAFGQFWSKKVGRDFGQKRPKMG